VRVISYLAVLPVTANRVWRRRHSQAARLYATVGDKKKLSLAALPPFRLWVRLTLIVYTR
ncbi:TPA: hypothetical protein ACWW92_005786, partial [Klebsiella pneumoniae]